MGSDANKILGGGKFLFLENMPMLHLMHDIFIPIHYDEAARAAQVSALLI